MSYPLDLGFPSAKNLTSAASTLIKTGAGVVGSITVNTLGATSTLKLYDGTSAGGTLLCTIDTTKAYNALWLLQFQTGLFAVTAGGTQADITITYA